MNKCSHKGVSGAVRVQSSAGGVRRSGKTSPKMSGFHKVEQVGVTLRKGRSATKSRTGHKFKEHPYLGVWGGRVRVIININRKEVSTWPGED